MACEILYIRQQKAVIIETRKQTRGSLWLFQLTPSKEFPAKAKAEGTQVKPSRRSPELKWKRWEDRETEATRLCRTECWEEENCTERKLQRSAWSYTWAFLWVLIIACWGWGKNHLEGLVVTLFTAHIRPGIMPVLTSQNGQHILMIHETLSRVHKIAFYR